MEVAGLSLAGPIVPPCFCLCSNPLFSPLGLANLKVHIVHVYASLPQRTHVHTAFRPHSWTGKVNR
jgi:hypothetical protein